jgi:cell wall-associated NlpC family hydrolase
MKRLTVLLVSTLVMAGCSASTNHSPAQAEPINKPHQLIASTVPSRMAYLTSPLPGVIKQLKSRIGKTWYVFSGWQPSGWDCSGLTKWAYARLGVVLPHSANAQGHMGVRVSRPQIGDVVVFGYGNYFVHAAIYVGAGNVIHAGFRPGTTTAIISLNSRNCSLPPNEPRWLRADWFSFVRWIPFDSHQPSWLAAHKLIRSHNLIDQR